MEPSRGCRLLTVLDCIFNLVVARVDGQLCYVPLENIQTIFLQSIDGCQNIVWIFMSIVCVGKHPNNIISSHCCLRKYCLDVFHPFLELRTRASVNKKGRVVVLSGFGTRALGRAFSPSRDRSFFEISWTPSNSRSLTLIISRIDV